MPKPLVPRPWRGEVTERMMADGSVHTADVEVVQAAKLVAKGATSIAIGFLHAYANPAHELAAAAIVRPSASGRGGHH